jgi:ribosome-binding protein aMBF1 (putative translation factor)
MENNETAKYITELIVDYVINSDTLKMNVELAIEEAVEKTVRVYAKSLIQNECSSDGFDTDELSRSINVSTENIESWEREVIRKLSKSACLELQKEIKNKLLSESSAEKPAKYQVLYG